MPRRDKEERGDLLQGTLYMLILRTVLTAPALRRPNRGHGRYDRSRFFLISPNSNHAGLNFWVE